jgi:hypothetical protein
MMQPVVGKEVADKPLAAASYLYRYLASSGEEENSWFFRIISPRRRSLYATGSVVHSTKVVKRGSV